MRHLPALSLLLLLAACAAPAPAPVVTASAAAPAPAAAASTTDVKMVCHREESVGTNMKHTVCEPENNDSFDAQQIARGVADQNTRVNPSAVHTTGH
jgi:hypothetical protein